MSGPVARWSEVGRWLDAALDVAPEQRTAWLDAQPLDAELRTALVAALADADVPGALDRLKETLAAPASDTAWGGRRVGPYVVGPLIGEGGSAAVFLATREAAGFRQRVALKLLRQGRFSADEQARFARERRILAALEHPHIARLIDGGVDESGVPYIAMEYVDGVAVTAHCDAQRLSVARRVALAAEICDVVAYAQRSLVVHRDLKPSNILVARDGTLKLLDFGIARLLDDDGHEVRTATVALRLTPGYAAPEQFERDGTITTATDVYALGVLLHELLVGVRPDFGADGIAAAPSTRVAGEAAAPRAHARASTPASLARALRGDFDTIVRTCLAAESTRRYADAAGLGADLSRWLAGQPIAARPASAAYRARKFASRHPFGAPATALAVSLLIGATAFSVRQTRIARSEAARAEQAAAQARQQAERAEASRNFLAQLFRQAAPGEPVPLKDVDALLARGAEMAEQQFAKTPEVASEILVTIGDAQREREHFDAAGDTLRRAFAAAEKADEGKGASTFRAQLLQGDIAFDTGAFVEGKTAMSDALARYRATANPRPGYIADALYIIGSMDVRLARHADAVAELEEAKALAQRHAQTDREADFFLPGILSMLAEAYNASGQHEKALTITDEILRRDEIAYGAEHETLAYDLANRSNILSNLARFDEAEAAARRAIALHVKARANGDSEHVVFVRNNLAAMLLLEDRIDEAQALLREALDAVAAAHSEDNPTHLTVLGNFGWAQALKGDWAGGSATLERAVAGLRQHLGADSPQTAASERSLATITWWRGDARSATAMLEHALEVDSRPGGNGKAAARDRIGLAKLALARGDAQAARLSAQATYDVLIREFPPVHPFVIDAGLTLAEALAADGDESARRCFEAARVAAADAKPLQHVMQARALLGLADLDAAAGADGNAKARRAEARAVLDASPSPRSTQAQRLRSRLADQRMDRSR